MLAVYDVSNPCNYRCNYCRNDWSTESNIKHSELKDIKKIIDKIVERGFKTISYTGGEFFLIPFWKDILMYASEKGLSNQVITNASLIEEKDIEFLERHLKRISVSFHSADKKQYNKIMGITDSGLFNKVLKNLKLIGESCMDLGIFFSPLWENYMSFFQTIKILKDKGIQITDVNLNRILPVGKAEGFLKKPLGYFEHALLIQQLVQINNELGINAYGEAYPLCFLNNVIENEEIIEKVNRSCIIGRKALALDSNGNIKLCPCAEKRVGASILDTAEVLDKNKCIEEFTEGRWRSEYCKNCSYWENCLGGCHASRGEMFSDDSLILDDEVVFKEGINNEFFDLLIDLYRPFLGNSFKKVPTAYTIFSKHKYKHPIGIIAIKNTKTNANFIEISLIPQLRGGYYSFIVLRKLFLLHPELKKIGWTSHKANIPSMKVLKKLRGGFFEKTVTNKNRIEAEGFFKVDGQAVYSMQKALDKQIELSAPMYNGWLEGYKTRTEELEKLTTYLEEYNEGN